MLGFEEPINNFFQVLELIKLTSLCAMDATHDNILYSFAVLEGCRFVTKLHSHATYLFCSDWTLWLRILCSIMRKTIVMISY